MPKTVDFHDDALAEAKVAAEWYAERDPAVAEAFAAELQRALERIRLGPERWPLDVGGTRRTLFRRFPYKTGLRRHRRPLHCGRRGAPKAPPGLLEDADLRARYNSRRCSRGRRVERARARRPHLLGEDSPEAIAARRSAPGGLNLRAQPAIMKADTANARRALRRVTPPGESKRRRRSVWQLYRVSRPR